jgi:hypothetical protein
MPGVYICTVSDRHCYWHTDPACCWDPQPIDERLPVTRFVLESTWSCTLLPGWYTQSNILEVTCDMHAPTLSRSSGMLDGEGQIFEAFNDRELQRGLAASPVIDFISSDPHVWSSGWCQRLRCRQCAIGCYKDPTWTPDSVHVHAAAERLIGVTSTWAQHTRPIDICLHCTTLQHAPRAWKTTAAIF